MARPSCGAGDGEDGREHVRRDTEGVIDRRGVEIHVGVQAFLFLHHARDALAHANPFSFAELLGEFHGHGAEVRCARVEHFVNAMADAHDFLFLRECVVEPCVHFVLAADFLEHVDDTLVRAAVQRTFERADGAGDGGIHVAQRGDGDACAERRGVHAVVGVQDVGDIECLFHVGARCFAIQQVEKVCGLAEVFADRRQVLAHPRAVVICGNDSDACGDAHGALAVAIHGRVVHVRVVNAEHRDSGADDVHRVRCRGRSLEEINHALRQIAVTAQRLREHVELALRGEFAIPEQVDDFLVAHFASEFVDVVAAVNELTDVAEHVGESGGVGDDSFETFCSDRHDW